MGRASTLSVSSAAMTEPPSRAPLRRTFLVSPAAAGRAAFAGLATSALLRGALERTVASETVADAAKEVALINGLATIGLAGL